MEAIKTALETFTLKAPEIGLLIAAAMFLKRLRRSSQ
jgi:hypothetical protein